MKLSEVGIILIIAGSFASIAVRLLKILLEKKLNERR
jgi:hypothetical protein